MRENPSVIEGSLAPLLKCARLLDFDNKRAYARPPARPPARPRRMHAC